MHALTIDLILAFLLVKLEILPYPRSFLYVAEASVGVAAEALVAVLQVVTTAMAGKSVLEKVLLMMKYNSHSSPFLSFLLCF